MKNRSYSRCRPSVLATAVLSVLGVGTAIAGVNPVTGLATMDQPFAQPDYFAIPNFAFSPLPEICTGALTYNCTQAGKDAHTDASGNFTPYLAGGMRKFHDGLPNVSYDCNTLPADNTGAKNNLGQCIPIAIPDTKSFPGQKLLANGNATPASDYYSIELVEYQQQMHSDLPASGTHLRGYRQVVTTGNNDSSSPEKIVTKAQYLGPVIFAQRGKPVRLKFKNSLATDIPLPVDTSYWGAGSVSYGANTKAASKKRAELHLHGGDTPWISDGTPHQWITPAGGDSQPAAAGFQKGFSFANVPDMVTNVPSVGCAADAPKYDECIAPALSDGFATYYYPNNLTDRELWYHDHSFGITRLNVYAGMAAAYFLVDNAEEQKLADMTVPGTVQIDSATGMIDPAKSDLAHLIPLVLQDKTFVPDNGEDGGQLALQDPTWPAPANAGVQGWGKGDLWLPHVYMPNQLPFAITDPQTKDVLSTAPMGRWDYGPWFSPPILANNPDMACSTQAFPQFGAGAFRCPGTPTVTAAPENFMDTPVINGTAYPSTTIDESAYRFRILNASDDRYWNLNLFYAVTQDPIVLVSGGAGSGAILSAHVTGDTVDRVDIVDPGTGYDPVADAGKVSFVVLGANGSGAKGTLSIDKFGMLEKPVVAAGGAGYVPGGTVCKNIDPNLVSLCTEVAMVPASPHRTPGNPTAPGPAVCTGPKTMTWSQQGQVTAPLDENGDLLFPVSGLPQDCWPDSWPTDGGSRYGGVPDPATAGPALVQIGNEGGVLPQAVVLPPTPNGFIYDRRMATTLLVKNHSLWLGPAERADVVADFSKIGVESGKQSVFVLVNDSVAPAPLFDPRYTMFTGDADLTGSGGAPITLPGYGPNTMTTMQLVVGKGTSNTTPFSLPAVMSTATGLPSAWVAFQEPVIVGEPSYPVGNGHSPTASAGSFNTFEFPNLLSGTISTVQVLDGGEYEKVPAVTLANSSPSGTNALASATLSNAGLDSLVFSNTGNYSSPPLVSFTGGTGSGATGVISMQPRNLDSITVVNGGTGYDGNNPPEVFVNGVSAGKATVSSGVTAINMTSSGAGYVSVPQVTFGQPPGLSGIQATGTATLSATGSIDAATVTTATCTGAAGTTVTQPVTFSGGTGAQATARIVNSGAPVVSTVTISVTAGGSNYPANTVMTIPTCTITLATVNVARTVTGVTVTNAGIGYTSPPTVSIGPPQVVPTAPKNASLQATATATIGGRITGVDWNNPIHPSPARDYLFSDPTFVNVVSASITPAVLTATLKPGPLDKLIVTNTGSYSLPPSVNFSCPATAPGCQITPAVATAKLAPRKVISVAVTLPGSGYKNVPDVTFARQSGDSRTRDATAVAMMSPVGVEFKGLLEGFDPIWGTLAIELTASNPIVTGNPQGIMPMPFAYVDPQSEMFYDNTPTTWRIDHIGVDTHAVHFHLANVQMINTVDLAGQIYMPDGSDLGWKDTVKVHPFQQLFVAMKPMKPGKSAWPNYPDKPLPWEVPSSTRPMDPTQAIGAVDGPVGCVANPFAVPAILGANCVPFSVVDPQGNLVVVSNRLVNFGWEYVWHCHLLGHEEHDMMRPISFVQAPMYAPVAPGGLPNAGTLPALAPLAGNNEVVSWADTTVSETGFILEQCTVLSAATNTCLTGGGTWTQVGTIIANGTQGQPGTPNTTGTTYSSAAIVTAVGTTYNWRVKAVTATGCQDNLCSNPSAGWPSVVMAGPASAIATLRR